MALKYTNNASTTLSANVTTSATSITVADASEFPTIGVGDYTYITLATSDATKIEIVKVELTSGTTFTIVRAQDNTTAQAFSSGDLCELRITAVIFRDALDSIVQGISDRKDFTVTTPTTVFAVTYDIGYIDVYLNGVRLAPSDYTATNNNNVTLATAAATGDVVTCIGWGTFTLANTALSDLNNVNAASPTNGQALTYDTTSSKWVASAAPQSATADYDVGDNVRIKLGTADDLQIYHDGSNSFIKDQGTGELKVAGSTIRFVNSTNSETLAVFDENAGCKLLFDNAQKLATTLTGIDVTGSVTTTGNVGIGTSSPTSGYKLDVNGKIIISQADAEIRFNAGGGWIGNAATANTVVIGTSSIERMRITSTGNVEVSTGNLVIGTAGKGIDFSGNSNASGMTSELLDDYEEGTWTPTIGVGSYAPGTWTSAAGWYTKIGDMVTVWFSITGSGMYFSNVAGYRQITNLPYAATQPSGSKTYAGSWSGNSVAFSSGGTVYLNNTIMYLHAANANANTSGVSGIGVSISYRA